MSRYASTRPVIGALSLVLFCACTSATPLGSPCAIDGECGAAAICDRAVSFQSICTMGCAADAECAGEEFPAGFVCHSSGVCDQPCSPGSGSSGSVCVGGRLVPCSEGDAARDCGVCGCEAFGGGTCVSGRGCVVAQPDGSACTIDAECSSRLCDPVLSECVRPVAVGEPCSYDVQCESGNCSTDGAVDTVGVCNLPLGSACMRDECTRCVGIDRILDVGFCSRRRCDPVNAPNCPPGWTCERTVDGDHSCYEVCDPEDFGRCRADLAFCHMDGLCY